MRTPAHIPRILWSTPAQGTEQDCACADERPPAILWSPVNEGAEDDCACVGSSAAPSPMPPLDAAALWQRPAGLYRTPLPADHELVYNPDGLAAVAVLNRPARQALDAFATPRPLTDPTARQLAALGLLAPSCTPEDKIRDTQHTLTAWLHVTDACNLRCSYCYVAKSGGAMDAETGRAAIDAVLRSALRHGFRAIKLKYAGGEPTLRFPLIQTLHAHAQRLAAENELELQAVVLSNGVHLPDALLDWLVTNRVRLMVSLDGIGASHDAQRPTPDGRGSADRVTRNIDRALAHGLRPTLSITVTAHNADHLVPVVAFALERDLPFNLNFVREPGVGQVGNLSYSDDHLIAGVQAAFAVIEAALPRHRLIDGLVDRAAFTGPHEYPCGAGRNYLVIDTRGRVARCQMEMGRPVSDVWADDPLSAVRADERGFQNRPVERREVCRSCTWRHWCAGGCPLLAHRSGQDDRSPYCQVYRALLPAALRLEGLRLLKQHA